MAVHWKKTICGICPAGCWIEAKLNQENRIIEVRADASHPLGALCHRGEKAPEIVYSPHRLEHPMRRKGSKGNFDFERVSWDEAYEIIIAQLTRIKNESGAEALAIYTGRGSFEASLCDIFQPKGVAVSSASSILFPFGSPNTMGVGALCYVSFAMIAPHVTMGRMLVNLFSDIENAEVIVVWGANPATDSPPLDMTRLESAAQRGARIYVIDPRHTETAKRTGATWIPIRPGTDGALALGMIQVLIDEDLHDEEFTENWCHGFDEFQTYVQHFRPEVVETITGVPAQTVRELARAIRAANGCAPVMYTGLEYSNSGIQAIRAAFTLWALAGQLDVPGGLCLAMKGSHFPINRSCNVANPDLKRAVARDRFPIYSHYRGESHASGLISAVLEGEPYKIRGLLIQGGSLLTSWPSTPIWRQTLSKLDFLVSIDRQLTADAAYADLVLPATTMFEIDSYMAYGPIFRIREKLIEPIGEARNDYRILAELAQRLGYGNLYPENEEQVLNFVLQGSGFTPDEIRAAGGWVKTPSPVMEYKKWKKGGLRPDREPGFDTPTGKFEIASTLLEEYGYEALPKYVEPKEGPLTSAETYRSFPLIFNSGARVQSDFRSQHHGVNSLSCENPWPSIQLNPSDANERFIRSGDIVDVSTQRGTARFQAIVTDDIVRGAVECNMGGGTPVGPEPWRLNNVNELTDIGNFDEISGFPVYKALLCEVRKTSSEIAAPPRPEAPTDHGPRIEQGRRKALNATRIYLDNNATTELSAAVHEEMKKTLAQVHGNPSSIHLEGRVARERIDSARRKVAALIGAKPRCVVFTGGGSESNNLALKGVFFANTTKGNHLITSRVEHPAVLATCHFLEKCGARITYLPVNEAGTLEPDELARAIRKDTVLISIMTANNETGVLQPIQALSKIARSKGVLFHTDAVQAAGKTLLHVDSLDVDLMTLSAHKIHGPKGVGALFIRKGVELEPLVHGGSQEHGLRAGTENVSAICGFGHACEEALSAPGDFARMASLRDELERSIHHHFPEARVNGATATRLPNTTNLTLPGIRGESLVLALDQHGIRISSGSACKSGSPDPTHVLLAMGRSAEEAHCSVRISLSRKTTADEIRKFSRIFAAVLLEMENTIRFLPCK
ncbi:MAG: aminotransferase V [Bdellovibrionales bacterium GWB1_55_8]|nr:MAG: aminotransferase V [Bdellovibrionales bacterium GWB1_55_8]